LLMTIFTISTICIFRR